MKCSLVILAALIGAAVSAPQSLYGPSYVVSSAGGPTYTVSNSQRGFSIETGGALPTAVRSGSLYSSQSSSSQSALLAAQQASAQLEAQRYAAEQAASQRYAAEQAASQRYAAEQAAAQRAAAEQAAAQQASAQAAAAQRAAAAQAAAQRAAAQASLSQRATFATQSAQLGSAQLSGASYSSGLRSGFQNAYIIRQNQDLADDGSVFNYGFESDNGISMQAQGSVKSFGPGPDDQLQAISGSYTYVGDDGQTYTVNYVADENGFQPQGAHLHPIPEEIQRSIQYNLANPQHPDTLLQKK